MLSLRGVGVKYGRIHALREVTMRVAQNEVFAVLGANGAGKTTLLRSVMGLADSAGEIEYQGTSLRRQPTHQRARMGIALVPEGRRLFGDFSVAENLRIGAMHSTVRGDDRQLEHVCGIFPVLKKRLQQRAGTLSGGEGQMLAIGRALMSRPKLLLLDEPSVGLMPKIVSEIFEMIPAIAKQGTTVLLVEQNAHRALSVSSRAAVLEVGKVVFEGPAAELLDSDRIRAAYLGG